MQYSTRTAEMIEQRGAARVLGTDLRIDFYTSQPSPSQWVAVATVNIDRRDTSTPPARSLVVGVGATEDSAMANMVQRISALACNCRAIFRRSAA